MLYYMALDKILTKFSFPANRLNIQIQYAYLL